MPRNLPNSQKPVQIQWIQSLEALATGDSFGCLVRIHKEVVPKTTLARRKQISVFRSVPAGCSKARPSPPSPPSPKVRPFRPEHAAWRKVLRFDLIQTDQQRNANLFHPNRHSPSDWPLSRCSTSSSSVPACSQLSSETEFFAF